MHPFGPFANKTLARKPLLLYELYLELLRLPYNMYHISTYVPWSCYERFFLGRPCSLGSLAVRLLLFATNE